MAGGTGQARGEVSSEPNVVPMIDILLVLLIIFMITQPLSRMAMDVQVPPPEQTTTTQQANNQIVLELADDGGYAINGQPVPEGPAGYPDPRDLRPPAGQAAVHQGRGRTGSTRT